MCLIAIAWQAHPRFPLVVAANRDEFFERPTAAAAWWDGDRILAGRDLRAGGTWMGVTRDGRFAALTNFRDPGSMRVDAPSRGALVSRFLESGDTAEHAAASTAVEAARYNGFNLLVGEIARDTNDSELWIVSSRDTPAARPVEPGVHALSNAVLDTPWPKVDVSRAALGNALLAHEGDRDRLCESLFALLEDDRLAPDEALPSTGIDREIERALSAAFIRMPHYGTRSSTVWVVDRDGNALFVERRTEAPRDARRFEFALTR